MSTPLALPAGATLALNLSLITDETQAWVERRHGPALLALKRKILHELEAQEPGR